MKFLWKTFLALWIFGFVAIGTSVYWTWSNFDHKAERNADCAVVFGAAVWKGDIPSHALYDRTITGIQLYQDSQVDCLIFSGGKSKMGAHEVDVMKKLALEAQIPENKIILDYDGHNTYATVNNLEVISEQASKRTSKDTQVAPAKYESFILVSNDFHLGRIRLLGEKFLDHPFQLHEATYHYGTYGRERYSFWREVAGTLWYGLIVW